MSEIQSESPYERQQSEHWLTVFLMLLKFSCTAAVLCRRHRRLFMHWLAPDSVKRRRLSENITHRRSFLFYSHQFWMNRQAIRSKSVHTFEHAVTIRLDMRSHIACWMKWFHSTKRGMRRLDTFHSKLSRVANVRWTLVLVGFQSPGCLLNTLLHVLRSVFVTSSSLQCNYFEFSMFCAFCLLGSVFGR